MNAARFLRRTVAIGALGAISVVYSEALFWARWRPGDSVGGYLVTWAAYSLVVYLVLAAIEHFGVRGVLGIALAGAIFGWLVEGAVAVTLYRDLPWSISWTALAWHGLLTVVFGWFLVPRALATWPLRRLVRWSVLVGAVWGIWAIGWRVQDGSWTPVVSFGLFAFGTALVLVLGYVLWQRAYVPARPQRWLILGAAALLALSAAIQAGAIAVVLPALVGVVVVVMRTGRGRFDGSGLVPEEPIRASALTAPPIAAASAVVVYAALQSANVVSNTAAVFYLFSMPAGFVVLVAAVSSVLKGMKVS
ncbi:MAG: hypothetical protein GXP34_01925 [Actinobacteria bacterium]|nr:hypothetical protein [Actinomycetota bacterium]